LLSAFYVIRMFLFCLIWVDSGAVWSLDARFAKTNRAGSESSNPKGDEAIIWPLRLMRIQVGLIYVVSGISKLFGASWQDGTALYFVLNSNQFRRFPAGVPASLESLTIAGSYAVLYWEVLFAPALLHPVTRRIALALGVVVHLSMWLFLEVGPFSWVMLATYLAFLDPERFRARAEVFLQQRFTSDLPARQGLIGEP
jgi:hypothetical protein